MPFKSEKQRRYLWANEPEIARDWTETYGSKIHAADGGIMRLPFGNGKGVDYDDHEMMIKVEELRRDYPDKYGEDVSDEEIIEFIKTNEGGETIDDTSWYKQPTLERMWNDPDRPQISKGLGTMRDWVTDKLGTGIDWGQMAMRGIGNAIMPGLGFALGMLPKDSAANKFNRSFTVGGANMPNDPYGYYSALRHGNLNQDPFGRNPVSMFGNYTGTLAKDANYAGTNKFNLAKKDFAQNYFDKNAINAGGVKVDNTVYSGADYQGGGGSGNNNYGAATQSGGFDPGGFEQDGTGRQGYIRGGIASL